jgi:hypothetical protein
MALKPKYLWYCVPPLGFVLTFFFGISLPKDWGSALIFLAPIESWWATHAAHPLLAAFFVGLSFGTVFFPEIWRVLKDHAIPSEPRPDWDLRDAVYYLRIRSKWAIGRIYYSPDEDRLIEQDIDEVLRDAASQGRISIWGRPAQTGVEALFSRGTELKISFADLQGMSLDLTTIDDGTAPNGAVLRAYSQDQYRFLRVNRREIYREWAPASYGRLFFDTTWKSRRLRIVPDVAEAHRAG